MKRSKLSRLVAAVLTLAMALSVFAFAPLSAAAAEETVKAPKDATALKEWQALGAAILGNAAKIEYDLSKTIASDGSLMSGVDKIDTDPTIEDKNVYTHDSYSGFVEQLKKDLGVYAKDYTDSDNAWEPATQATADASVLVEAEPIIKAIWDNGWVDTEAVNYDTFKAWMDKTFNIENAADSVTAWELKDDNGNSWEINTAPYDKGAVEKFEEELLAYACTLSAANSKAKESYVKTAYEAMIISTVWSQATDNAYNELQDWLKNYNQNKGDYNQAAIAIIDEYVETAESVYRCETTLANADTDELVDRYKEYCGKTLEIDTDDDDKIDASLGAALDAIVETAAAALERNKISDLEKSIAAADAMIASGDTTAAALNAEIELEIDGDDTKITNAYTTANSALTAAKLVNVGYTPTDTKLVADILDAVVSELAPSALKKAITAAEAAYAKVAPCTNDTAAAYDKALADAKALVENKGTAAEEAVAIAALETAVENLVSLKNLVALIDEANAILEGSSDYDLDSMTRTELKAAAEALEKAIAAAEAVRNDNDATAVAILAAEKTLEDAIAAFPAKGLSTAQQANKAAALADAAKLNAADYTADDYKLLADAVAKLEACDKPSHIDECITEVRDVTNGVSKLSIKDNKDKVAAAKAKLEEIKAAAAEASVLVPTIDAAIAKIDALLTKADTLTDKGDYGKEAFDKEAKALLEAADIKAALEMMDEVVAEKALIEAIAAGEAKLAEETLAVDYTADSIAALAAAVDAAKAIDAKQSTTELMNGAAQAIADATAALVPNAPDATVLNETIAAAQALAADEALPEEAATALNEAIAAAQAVAADPAALQSTVNAAADELAAAMEAAEAAIDAADVAADLAEFAELIAAANELALSDDYTEEGKAEIAAAAAEAQAVLDAMLADPTTYDENVVLLAELALASAIENAELVDVSFALTAAPEKMLSIVIGGKPTDGSDDPRVKMQVETSWDDDVYVQTVDENGEVVAPVEGQVTLEYTIMSADTKIIKTAQGTYAGQPKGSCIIMRGMSEGETRVALIVTAYDAVTGAEIDSITHMMRVTAVA